MGWRFQVPLLLSLGLQVVVPDMLGYGQTSAPDSHEEYTMKKMTGDMAHIIKEVTDQPVILGGHDWGGFFVCKCAGRLHATARFRADELTPSSGRMLLYYPELIRAIFSLCVPYMPPAPKVITLEQLGEKAPNFKYQQQLASGKAEEIVSKTPEGVRQFLNGMYGGRTPEGQHMFSPTVGILEENLGQVGKAALVSQDIIDFYVQEYSRNGLHGPCNWYRTTELNGHDGLALAAEKNGDFQIKIPAMLVMAGQDSVLLPKLADGQEKFFAAGLKREIVEEATHWIQVQCPEETNKHISDFVKSVLA